MKNLLWVGGALGGIWSLLAFQGYLIKRLAAKEGVNVEDDEALKEWANQRMRASSGSGGKFYRDILLQRPKKAPQ